MKLEHPQAIKRQPEALAGYGSFSLFNIGKNIRGIPVFGVPADISSEVVLIHELSHSWEDDDESNLPRSWTDGRAEMACYLANLAVTLRVEYLQSKKITTITKCPMSRLVLPSLVKNSPQPKLWELGQKKKQNSLR